ncbi:MAG: hypothetical protein ACREJ2_02155, partial [Planctomycetota bacterium]
PGARVLIDVPAPGAYAWSVVAGDGRIATPPVAVRLVVLADAQAGAWAVPYPAEIQLEPGDRFAVDLRGVSPVQTPETEAAGSPPPGPPVAPATTAAAGSTGGAAAATNLARDWKVVWTDLASSASPSEPASTAPGLSTPSPAPGAHANGANGALPVPPSASSQPTAPTLLSTWRQLDPAFGPRVGLFQVPTNTAPDVYTLHFRILAGSRTIQDGAVRLVVRPHPAFDESGDPTEGPNAVTRVVTQPLAARLPVAQAGLGAPVIALPYGDATIRRALDEPLDLDGRLCSDPDGDPLTFHWWHTRSPAAAGKGTDSFTVLGNPALWRWTPTRKDDIGMHEFVLSVSDGKHLVYSPPVRVIVSAEDTATTTRWRVAAPPRLVTGVGQEVHLTVHVERFDGRQWLPDFDGVEPRWAQVSRPPGVLRIDPDLPLSRFQPFFHADQPGIYRLEFSVAAADHVSNIAPVTVEVLPPNRPPSLLENGPLWAVTDAGKPISIDLTASDPDGDPVEIHWRLVDGPGRSVGQLTAAEGSLEFSGSGRPGVTTSAGRFLTRLPGVWQFYAWPTDGHATPADGLPLLIWVRPAQRAPFGPFSIEPVAAAAVAAGKSNAALNAGAARAGDAVTFQLVGPGAHDCFVRWAVEGAPVDWESPREGAAVRLRCDPTLAAPGSTAAICARVEDGLGRAVEVALPLRVLPAPAVAKTKTAPKAQAAPKTQAGQKTQAGSAGASKPPAASEPAPSGSATSGKSATPPAIFAVPAKDAP